MADGISIKIGKLHLGINKCNGAFVSHKTKDGYYVQVWRLWAYLEF